MTQPQSTTTNMCTPLHIETPTNDDSVFNHRQGCDEQNGTVLRHNPSISIFQNHDSTVGHDGRKETKTKDTCHDATNASTTTTCSGETSSTTSAATTTATCTTTTTTTHPRMVTHLVLSTDTLAGLLLTYRISKQALQRANPGCIVGGGNAVQVGDRLHIPMTHNNNVVPVQDTSTLDYQTAAVLEQCRFLTIQQAQSYVTRNHYNIDHAIQHAKAVRQQQQDQLARQAQVERQRKQDAMEIQRILLVQQQQQAKQQAQQAMMHNQSTELTSLMNNTSSNANHHPSMYLDEPNEPEKDQGKPLECVAACCSLVGLVVVEWIRHAIPLPQV